MSERYFSQTPISGNHLTLAGSEAHHLLNVMRAKPGMRITLFDGSGAEFAAAVEKVGRSDIALTILSRHEVDREIPFDLVLGISLPKGDRQKWLVEKAVELGVSRIVPLITARSIAQPVQQALERLRRTVVEASKQCGRNRLLEITEPEDWADFVAMPPSTAWRLIAHPGTTAGPTPPASPEPHSKSAHSSVFLAIGPEGGFASDEVAQANLAGWQAVDLGPRILRVETAALYLSSWVIQGFVPVQAVLPSR